MQLPLSVRTPTFLLAAAIALTAGCSGADGGGESDGRVGSGSFESDSPVPSAGAAGRSDDAAGGNAGATPQATGAEEAESGAKDSAERAIVEADIIQLNGDRLYALSRIGGLSVIDVSDPKSLKLLGRHRQLSGEPFEMYLQGDVVFAMFSSWGEYVEDGDGYSFVQTSKLVALDVSDPSDIATLGSFDVAGAVSDSRIVGKVLYVVGYEDGYCWGCQQNKPRTTVVSLDLSDPRAPRKVDELSFADGDNTYGWSRRSITVSDKRMYVAGPEYGQNGPTGSSIQVVDISSPTGDMVEGAVVKVAGQVSSRWQMDEYDGVLRVISQPMPWSAQGRTPPRVQTYRVSSASELSALGSTALVVPDNRETLRSVRFDGPRAYAITALQQDPLFTIDLSDPANPRQAGELHMPGFVYHMEPRGERLIGLGFEQGNVQGAITVAVFDVSNLATPKLLSRVNFGGNWASLPEDQDRIHKAFRILPELGLVLVPFSGSTDIRRDDQKRCAGSYQSGVQLIDLTGDVLQLRGTAPSVGEARRALVHRDHLLTVSDARVETFDIRDRNAPAQTGSLSLARFVERVVPLDGNIVARINSNYWSDSPWIDLVGADDVGAPQISLGELSLSQALRGDSECSPYSYVQAAFGKGSQVEILYRRYEYSFDYRDSKEVAGVLVIDASDPSAPKLAGKVEWDMAGGERASSYQWYSGFQDYAVSYNPNAVSFARAGDVIVALESSTQWSDGGGTYKTRVRLRSVDLTDPSAPVAKLVDLGERHYSGLSASGDDVLLGFSEQGSKAGKIRFFVQRVAIADPAAISLGQPINVPGLLLHHDARTDRLVTSELKRAGGGKTTGTACDQRFGFFEFKLPSNTIYTPDKEPEGSCEGYQQTLHLVKLGGSTATLEDSLQIEVERVVSSSSASDDRVFAVLGGGNLYYGWGIVDDCFGCRGGGVVSQADPVELLVLSGFGSGTFESGRLSVESADNPWWGFWGSPPVYAHGTSALLTGYDDLTIVDASDASRPRLVSSEPLFGGVSAVSFQDASAFLALGQAGAQRVALP